MMLIGEDARSETGWSARKRPPDRIQTRSRRTPERIRGSSIESRFCGVGKFAMRKPGWKSSIVPYGADQTVYLVIDRFGQLGGGVYRETEVERTDLETVITDLTSGQFNDPIRVVAFNTLEHWSEDVSEDIAREIQTRCDIEGERVPEHIQDFVERHQRHERQLALRLL
jgi:hypothetical protein